jgi:hypothetical protein
LKLQDQMRNLAHHLQNDDLKMLRCKAHDYFDVLWKEEYMTRSEAYKWLRKQMELTKDECHIALFNREQCHQVVKLVNEYFNDDFAEYPDWLY